MIPTDLKLIQEQDMLVEVVRSLVEKELLPHEDDIDRIDAASPELAVQVRGKALAAGFYALSMPEEVGGGSLDYLSQALVERELSKASWALHVFVAWSPKILAAYTGEQLGGYLLPYVQGEKTDCSALTEPGADPGVSSIKTRVVCDGDTFVISGSKHFISHAGHVDFAIVLVVADSHERNGRKRNAVTAFPVDKGMPGVTVRRGSKRVSNRGYHTYEIFFGDCQVPASKVLGEVGKGWEVANAWLTAGRVMVAANCVGQAQRALDLSLRWAADRKRSDQPISSYQGVSSKLTGMATQIRAVELMTLHTAWRMDQSTMIDGEAGMVKLFASETLGKIADEAVQIFGGVGLMDEGPIERTWRNVRTERIQEGTSEIQRHIVSRELLRPLLR